MILGKTNIRPTAHYLFFHRDVEWSIVLTAILSPTKTKKDRRYGKDRPTYIKHFKEYSIKVHARFDMIKSTLWVINAFKTTKEK